MSYFPLSIKPHRLLYQHWGFYIAHKIREEEIHQSVTPPVHAGATDVITIFGACSENPKCTPYTKWKSNDQGRWYFSNHCEGATIVLIRNTSYGIIPSKDTTDRENILWRDLHKSTVEFWTMDFHVNFYIKLKRIITHQNNMTALYSIYQTFPQTTDRD